MHGFLSFDCNKPAEKMKLLLLDTLRLSTINKTQGEAVPRIMVGRCRGGPGAGSGGCGPPGGGKGKRWMRAIN